LGKKCPIQFATFSIPKDTVLSGEQGAGPRINADDVAPSYGLFLTTRGKNMHTII
jgi:hypothetical protein